MVFFLQKPEQKNHHHMIIENNSNGINEIMKYLKKIKITLDKVLFCFEDTGVYSCPLMYYLSKKQLDYWMVPAIEIKRSKGISRGKTDKSDAKDIAYYAHTHLHKLRLGSVSSTAIAELKLLMSERDKLMKAIKMFGTIKENEGFLPSEILQETMKVSLNMIKHLQKNLDKIETRMSSIIAENQDLEKQKELLESIPGIGFQTAVYLIVATRGFKNFQNWRQLACYAGVAPFEHSSGSSIRGRTKTSHLADKKLKSLLNMCALSAIRYDIELKTYYEKKVSEGKNKMLVINNIRGKLLARAFAVINREKPYVNTRKYAS